MVMHKSKYKFVEEELKIIREKIKYLRQIPARNITERIYILRKINFLLNESNDLLIVRQKLLEGKNTLTVQKIDIIESRLK